MNSNPFVSVVMSVYNGGEFLKDAINSILSQSYKNFEFIIIMMAPRIIFRRYWNYMMMKELKS